MQHQQIEMDKQTLDQKNSKVTVQHFTKKPVQPPARRNNNPL